MSLLQSLLFPELPLPPVNTRIVSAFTDEDTDVAIVPVKKRIRGPRGGGKQLAASGERNIYFSEIRQSFYVLITHNGKRRGKYGFHTISDAVVARAKFEAELKREGV